MTLTEQLAQAFQDLLAQGSFGVTKTGACDYLTPEGKSCIAGLWINRHYPATDLTQIGGSFMRRNQVAAIPRIDPFDEACIQAAQSVHDAASNEAQAPSKENLLEAFGQLNLTHGWHEDLRRSSYFPRATEAVKTILEQLP